ncbi:type VI secretion system secreted protein VgrG [Pseudomonas sp. 43mfcvi1.1]|uniref:type VI secretion system Vgr family protein n=1 Tax=Pseudomonas sp. 43mfcvi1.1 TaxID=1761894 RepID=UPI000D6D618D|nr:type VI secretion system tip protein TssI/VgrG [Pseudomonas sp. 43mfcvi1.1]PWJ41554.1 type VI secretion system secreted protein VgrG [Pseudomonas sp. 43mfcvi1.1]SSB94707.1 type VI secretion system secreted protein VgrG [Pseudomonas sp. 43mfcvi1.1]
MRNDTESPFSLTLTQSDLQLQVLRFNGREALNQPYRFDLELIGLAPPINPDLLLGHPAFLRLDGESGVHGIVHSVSLNAQAPQLIVYRLTLVPYLQQLEQGPRRRVFHQLSVVQVLQRLLEEHPLPTDSYRFELPHGQYPCRPFCIQYDESDLTFLQRLCEEEGIHYHFEHAPHGHVLVFAEDPKSFPARAIELPLRPSDNLLPAIKRLYLRHHSRMPGLPVGFSDRAMPEAGATAANHLLEQIDHEAMRGDPALAHRYQAGRRHLERLRCRQREIHGHSTQPALHGGDIVQVCEHPVATFNDQWLITEVQHRGRQFSILEPDLPATPSARDYRNRFTAIPWSTVFRPALKHPKPCIPGYHLAHVLGRTGQPARPDERGQVSVSLWAPDQEGITLPVSRLTLGDSPSLMAGSEVLVSFLDGDPDRPVLCPGAIDTGAGQTAVPPKPPRGNHDAGLLLDWLLNPPDFTP